MAHARTDIRNAVVAALTGLATCGAHVYPSRLTPLTASELPAMLVTTGREDNDLAMLVAGLPAQRMLEVTVFIVVKAASGYEATADTILGEIEARLFDTAAHNTLGGAALSTTLASIDSPEMDDSTDQPVVRLPVILRVTYTS